MKKKINDMILQLRDYAAAHSKVVFPILLIAAVAVMVVIALRAGTDKVNPDNTDDMTAGDISAGDAAQAQQEIPDYPIELNAYPAVNTIIRTYFDSMAAGDADAIAAIQSSMDDLERIKIVELGKYIESYPVVDVYTKPGPEENSYIVIAYNKSIMSYYPEDELPGYSCFYVCTKEDGSLYINQDSVPEEISEYIRAVVLQDDVVELCNTIEVEYKELCIEKPELFNYVAQVEQEVKTAAGVILAQQIAENGGEDDETGGEDSDAEVPEYVQPDEPVITGPVYATATTTVNVRSSDSETADKLGKLTKGTKVEVLEQLVNGWDKIVFDGKEGYVKAEYLSLIESAQGAAVIGTVTAMTTVNVREAPSETSAKMGVVTTGQVLDLIESDNGWCKIVYNGQIGYIKADYLE